MGIVCCECGKAYSVDVSPDGCPTCVVGTPKPKRVKRYPVVTASTVPDGFSTPTTTDDDTD